MERRMVIIGAGIAGLSTGCYARMNGYETDIYEMHRVPGGLCTAWKRKGYTFDISMHMLTGSRGGPVQRMWHELGILRDRTFIYHDILSRVESREKILTLCTDPRRLEEQMAALSPADSKLTKEFVRLFTGRDIMGAMSLKPAELSGFFDKLKMITAILPLMGAVRKYGKMTLQEFALRFKDPFLRDAVRFVVDSPGWPMLRFPMIALAGFTKSGIQDAGVPLGGSQKVIFRMAENYQALGGGIHYQSRVTDVIIEKDRAVGVRLEDGTEHRADTVVWAGDGHTVIFDILGGRYLDDEVRRIYREWTPVLPLVHVMMGVNRDMSNEPHRIIFEPDNPIDIAGEKHRWLCFLHHCFDPSMAPPGKSATEVWYATRYEYWEELARDRVAYEAEKKRIADFTIAALDKRWPGFASQVEVVDVPTPATYFRYTGNWQGSPDGWYITPENMMKQAMLRSLPGLSGFYMVGQWTTPFSGTVLAALSGRQLIQLLCKWNGKTFITSVP
ncbi:MAG: NAD(P)/FAD-dependent oxidoreductase [Deltaproteobacteria bacterium]|nr:NAD(P)/FAD-dependent oxidoreductase [Deltaproteobacteria bacterium]